MLKRVFDIFVSLIAGMIFLIPMMFVGLAVALSSKGPILYWSRRLGRNHVVFNMPKFRTMRTDTPVLPTHLLPDAQSFLTPIGSFLRKSSLDELPQLWCILKGEMSFVGPRPSLESQSDLNDARTSAGVHWLLPGLTGWAQVNGRDELPTQQKVALDAEYLQKKSFLFDVKIILLTLWKVVKGDGVKH
jgi:O-antigen biosynthesis protein WbqP